MVAYSFRQIKESADRVEEDCFEHRFREGEHPARPFAASLLRIFVEEECSANDAECSSLEAASVLFSAGAEHRPPGLCAVPLAEKLLGKSIV
jgi:hypothetical protein